jgi:NhaA family Na+:H+ antiporter
MVALAVLPLLTFANLGLTWREPDAEVIAAPLTITLILVLFVGKPLGIVAGTRAAVALGLAELPSTLSWLQLYGIAALCGIGGTATVLLGSLLSGLFGYALLRRTGFRARN